MRRLLLPSLLALACDSDDGGNANGAGTSSSSGDSGSPGTSAATETTDSDDGGTTDGGSNGSSGSGSATGGVPSVAKDCKSQLEIDPASADGVYQFNIGGFPTAETFEAYCDMTTDGGGWTLVGRSAPQVEEYPTTQLFGWHGALGSLDNDLLAYSLNAAEKLDDAFTEVLFGSYSEGKTWGGNAYKFAVPEHFIFLYRQAPLATEATTVLGECAPEGGPVLMRFIGWTENPYQFIFEDDEDEQSTGLERPGFDSTEDCDVGGMLGLTQGMVFVR